MQTAQTHLRLVQLVQRPLDALQHVAHDLEIVLVLLEHRLELRQHQLLDRDVVQVVVHVRNGHEGGTLEK